MPGLRVIVECEECEEVLWEGSSTQKELPKQVINGSVEHECAWGDKAKIELPNIKIKENA